MKKFECPESCEGRPCEQVDELPCVRELRAEAERLRTALQVILRQSDVDPGERIPVGTIWRLAHNALAEKE